ncbi:MAG: 50S ribosomal protein L15 [Chloroflexota bacterium]
MKHIGNLQYSEGAKHSKKRIGRGPGSGHGGTSTRGHKGQKSISGYNSKPHFEGGQMPMNRRLPKFGFTNRFRVEYQTINVGRLQELADENLFENNVVDFDTLWNLRIINKKNMPVKILGVGELTAALTVKADGFSGTAKQKIESAGGAAEING